MRAGPEGSQGADVWWWLGLRREGELWGEAGDNREVSAGSLGVAGKCFGGSASGILTYCSSCRKMFSQVK